MKKRVLLTLEEEDLKSFENIASNNFRGKSKQLRFWIKKEKEQQNEAEAPNC